MFKSRKLGILGLALCATIAGATAPGLTTHVSAAPAAPTVAVAARLSTSYLNVPIPRAIAVQRLTLHITGSNFTPGSKIRLAVMDTSSWEVFARGSTKAQAAVITWACGFAADPGVCSRPNPKAGTIDYRMRITNPPATSNLAVLYRSAGPTGMRNVTLGQR